MSAKNKTVALCGNPNVGKSTVFNALTGLKQHTGNWAGKTVELSFGNFTHEGVEYELVDLPGIYSYSARSHEQEIARDFITSGEADCVVVVCDATALERNLHIVLRTLEICGNVIVALNMIDEAEKQNINIDIKCLERMLDAPVTLMSARDNRGISELKCAIKESLSDRRQVRTKNESLSISRVYDRAREICKSCITKAGNGKKEHSERADIFLTNKYSGVLVMLLGLGAILFLTIFGANYPSQILSSLLLGLEKHIASFLVLLHFPRWLTDMLTQGGYRVLAYVVSVMLPPMAIFFPLFTILEDLGYLPRVAFNLDGCFRCCSSCGKQALTMCMGLGCNAVGVTGCRIIDSKRERLIAILTNSLIPCNGRFPTLITVITMFLTVSAGGFVSSLLSAGVLMLFIVLAVLMTFLLSKLLSKTVLKGTASSFTLELPPYRRPQFKKIIVRSVIDRTLKVLSRAVCVSFPAGMFLWIMGNVEAFGSTLFAHATRFLNPFAQLLGLDGVILLAFILALPANEIVMPIIIMGYLSVGSISEVPDILMLKELLLQNGWNILTAISIILFSLFHWPCSTTLLTIKKETGSVWWTALSAILPTLLGVTLCLVLNSIF